MKYFRTNTKRFMVSKIAYAMFVGIALFSCNSEDLDKNALTELSSETFWQSEDDVEVALAAVYSHLTYGPLSWRSPELSTISDENDLGQYADFARGAVETNNSVVTGIYNELYRTLANCNDFLSNVGRVEMDEGLRQQYIGEVKLIRALSHFRLTTFFGDVVLAMEPLTMEDGKRARTDKEEVLDAILQDLDDAISGLPENPYNGHAVRGTAYALKGKVLLYRENYQAAVDAFEQVLDTNFSLDDDLKHVFIDGFQENSPEILLSANFLAPNAIMADRTGMDVLYGEWFQCVPLQSFVDDFLCADGLSIWESPLYDPENPYENRDPRLDVSVLYPGTVWAGLVFDGTTSPSGHRTPNGLAMKKFLKEENFPTTEYVTQSEQDWVIIRFADVLLMYAEALNELSGPVIEVYNAINEVRQRPSTNMPVIPQGLSKEEMREAIRLERKIELAFEGSRYFDLKRWGIIEEVVNNTQNVLGVSKVFLPHQVLWPIPEAARNNNDLLDQNEGY